VIVDYAGAGARLELERAMQLDADRWAWQPKIDGCYVRVSTDRRGRIASVVTRAGAPIGTELLGTPIGLLDAVLAGELEAHTEAGERAAAIRGWRNVHLFDVSRLRGVNCAGLPYRDRYASLHREQALAELELEQRYVIDDQGDAHDRAGRYSRPVPRDCRRTPIVPMSRGAGGGRELWRTFVDVAGGEGLVAVRLDAPLGARGAKRKVKVTDTLEAVVLEADGRAAALSYRGHRFVVSARGAELVAGDIVEVRHDGWYEGSVTPRFARIVRVRNDLS
jgi:hypothetical protein